MHTVNVADILCGAVGKKRHERLLLMAAFTAQGGGALYAVVYGSTVNITFSCPGAVQDNLVIARIIHIDGSGHYFFKHHRFRAGVYDADASYYRINVFKNAVGQNGFYVKHLVLQCKLQCLRILFAAPGSRQSL